MNRVIVTGIGVFLNVGHNLAHIAAAIHLNRCDRMRPDTINLEEMNKSCLVRTCHNYDPIIMMMLASVKPSILRITTRLDRLLLCATINAAKTSSLNNEGYYPATRIGVSVASTVPSIPVFDKIKNNKTVTNDFMCLGNNPGTILSQYFGAEGRTIVSSASCASSIQSVILGYEAIASGKADCMICGGADEFHPYFAEMFHRLHLYSDKCKPFSRRRNGIIVGEGAAVLILENYRKAKAINTPYIAEIVSGSLSTSDSIHISDRNSIFENMLSCIHENVMKNDALYVDAHATGTIDGDAEEAEAIRKLHAMHPISGVTALKGILGHTMAASGLAELSIQLCAYHLHRRLYSDIQDPDPKFSGIPFVENQLKMNDKSFYLLKNSFGLGGNNASLLLKVDSEE